MTTQTDRDMPEHPGLDEPRPGQELRAARERAGIDRESMAERLRLALAQFDALENDDYAALPPPTFVRGYFRAYARELGLDHEDYIAAYNRSGVSARDPEISRGGVTDRSSGGRGGMFGLLLIALVAAGGIGAWWYQQRMVDGGGDTGEAVRSTAGTAGGDSVEETANRDTGDGANGDTAMDDNTGVTEGASDGAASGEGDPDPESTAEDEETASVDVEAAGAADGDAVEEADSGDSAGDGEAVDAEGDQSVVSTDAGESPESGSGDTAGDATEVADAGDGSRVEEDAGDSAAGAANDADTTAGSTAADEPGSTSPAATDSPTRAATEAAATGPDEVTLEFTSRSWLEVYDSRDRELVYTLYFGSEPITLQGWAPFEIFLGDSPAVTVRFNGDTIDKSDFTRGNNTARFVVDAAGVRSP